ncbi:ATP-dependent DNA helicase DinG [Desulfoscipio geothermicus DSM 3669]|uniref:3'-5' exonuclease DinG n=1 Tax=Desulfoscipio geothermicus DSM 3669 TaxID=1121426 RepID=A0A1I6DM37_9FIRM|nr:ATP-dependent DNA helicase DinG [Desulfoscipio geothermicus DSM 3669]
MHRGSEILQNFVVCDLETTGFDHEQDKIIEIALVKVIDGEIIETFDTLINPHTQIPLKIKRLTGITGEQLASSPTLDQVLPQIQRFLQNVPLVGHNIAFDRSFLSANIDYLPFTFYLDTLELARITLPDIPGHSLASLVQYLQLPQRPQHRALNDALSTTELLFALLQKVSSFEIGVLHRLVSLLRQGRSPLTEVVENVSKNKIQNFSWEKISRRIPVKEPVSEPEPESLEMPKHINEPGFQLDYLLGVDSPLAGLMPNYSYRPEQVRMAQTVKDTLEGQKILLVEAGTGTGKSIAYLLPALLWTLQNEQRAVIATNTINLQEQIWHKDIPLLQRLLNLPFKGALLKGRSNYLCLHRFISLLNNSAGLTRGEALLTARVLVWLQNTDSGDKTELNLFGPDNESWLQLCSESESCLGNGCRWSSGYCFVNRARRRAEDAHLVIINHSLLFSDIVSDIKILPPHGALIIDEAHNIDETAYKHLGKKITRTEIIQWLSLAGKNLKKLTELAPPQDGQRWLAAVNKAEEAKNKLMEKVNVFFKSLVQHLKTNNRGSYSQTRVRLHREPNTLENIEADYQNLLFHMRHFITNLHSITQWLEIWTVSNDSLTDILQDINNNITTGTGYLKDIDFIIKAPEDNYVCWVEVSALPGYDKKYNCDLHATPIDISEILHERLFDTSRAIILTSATMTVNNRFDHFIKQCGLDRMPKEMVNAGIIQSPFNYDQQCLLCIADNVPNFNETDSQVYLDTLADTIFSLALETEGRTLVLFTSHKLLKEAYLKTKPAFDEVDICLLGHNIDGSRTKLIEQFTMNRRSVLFGAFSFWEGVDIPGEALVNVIIVKLPFAPPDDPVLEARNEKIAALGYNGFYTLSLPSAVIRFKQGFGRLIRSERDRGVVVILDKRILEKRYGKIFLNSLPVKSHLRGDVALIRKKLSYWILHAHSHPPLNNIIYR